jgi:hypothetical protein
MGGAKYWTWFEPPLTFELLDKFYGNFVVKNYPDLSKTDLATFPFSGGIVHFADPDSTKKNGWIVLYRSFYGGERDKGRHGVVILTAWIRANEIFETLLPVFNNETFKFIGQHAKELPVPAPASLTEKSGENVPEKWQKGLEKFAPYITPRFDSHLKITDNPTGLNYDQSAAFAKDRAEWDAEHIDKETALEGQVNTLTENVTHLKSTLDNTYQTLNAVRSDLDRKRNELNRYRESINGTVIKLSAICTCAVFVVMFIVSCVSPNWSADIVKSINPFSSSAAKPTLEQQLTDVEKQLTEVAEKLKNFDGEKEKGKLETEKKELDAKKQTLEAEKQKKEQENQNKKEKK